MRPWPVIILALALAGCGFAPLYGPARKETPQAASGDVAQVLATIAVAPGDTRLAQVVRNRLVGALTPRGYPADPRYRLSFALEEQVEGFAFRPDRAVTRERIEVRAHYVLVDAASEERILEGDSTASSSYDVVQSDFANISAQRDARRRAADVVADRIAARLARYFRASGGEVKSLGQGQP